jgi:hypothetical protein
MINGTKLLNVAGSIRVAKRRDFEEREDATRGEDWATVHEGSLVGVHVLQVHILLSR